MSKFYPIIIFCYNRISHLKKTLFALSINSNIKKHKIYVFCDGPKNIEEKKKIDKINNFLLRFNKLKFEKITNNKNNIGLASNVINGVSKILKKNEAVIVIEDDIVLGANSLAYINFMLNKFSKNNRIGSVSAFSYINNNCYFNGFDYFLTKRHSSWAWGTWARVWNDINWHSSINFESLKMVLNSKFKKLGLDLPLLLWGESKNFVSSWAVRFNYYCFKKKLLSIQPRYSLVENIGNDFSGTHLNLRSIFFKDKKVKFNPVFENVTISKLKSNSEIDKYIQYNHKRSHKLIFRFILVVVKNLFNFNFSNKK